MRKELIVASVLLLAQLALAAALAQRDGALNASPQPKPLLQGGAPASVDRLVVTGEKGDRLEVKREKEGWRLPGYFGAPVAEGKAKSAIEAVAGAKLDHPVATSKGAAERFEVAEGRFSRKVELFAGKKRVAAFFLGKSAGVDRTYLRPFGEKNVYAAKVPEWRFPAKPERWFDQELLRPEAKALDAVEVDGLKLVKKKEGWRLEGNPGARLKEGAARHLLSALAGARADAIAADEPDPSWHLDKPLRRLALHGKAGDATWLLYKPKKKAYHLLKSSRHPWYLKLESWNAKPLLDASSAAALVERGKGSDEEKGSGSGETKPAKSAK